MSESGISRNPRLLLLAILLTLTCAAPSPARAAITVDSVRYSDQRIEIEPGKFETTMTLSLRSDSTAGSASWVYIRPHPVDPGQYRGSPAIPLFDAFSAGFNSGGGVSIVDGSSTFMWAAQTSCMDPGAERRFDQHGNLFESSAAAARITLPPDSAGTLTIGVAIDTTFAPFGSSSFGPRVWISDKPLKFRGKKDGAPENAKDAGGRLIAHPGTAVSGARSSRITLRVNGRGANWASPLVIRDRLRFTVGGSVVPRRNRRVRIYAAPLGDTHASHVRLIGVDRTDDRGRFSIRRVRLTPRTGSFAIYALVGADAGRNLRRSASCGYPVTVR